MNFRKNLLTLATLALPLASASGFAEGTSFDFTFKNSSFNLTVQQVFPATVSLSNIINIYSSGSNQSEVSPVIDSVTRTDTDRGVGKFIIDSRATKTGVSRSTRLNCQESISKSSWTQSCAMDPNFSDNKKSFVNAQFQTSTSCSAKDDGTSVRCVFTSKGSPTPVSFLFVKRSALRLSVSGSVENLHSLAALYNIASESLPAKEASAKEHSQPIGQATDDMYTQGIAEDSNGVAALRIQGSSSNHSVSVNIL